MTPHFFKNFSEERFQTYLDLANHNASAAVTLYEYNIKLSESFYPCLHNLEISLRNNFHLAIAKTYGKEWFLNNSILIGSKNKNSANIEKVAEAISRTKSFRSGTVLPHEVISNLSFGFWVSLLFAKYEIEIWRPCLRSVFPQNQKILREDIQKKLELARLIRNRIAHHECILKHDLNSLHIIINEIMNYLSPELANWSSTLDRFPVIFTEYQNFLSKLRT